MDLGSRWRIVNSAGIPFECHISVAGLSLDSVSMARTHYSLVEIRAGVPIANVAAIVLTSIPASGGGAAIVRGLFCGVRGGVTIPRMRTGAAGVVIPVLPRGTASGRDLPEQPLVSSLEVCQGSADFCKLMFKMCDAPLQV